MTFEDVLRDVEEMTGLRLDSIKSGSSIKIVKVDWEHTRILITTASGTSKARPFSEIRKIWQGLVQQSAIHVDKVLGGSGSSRNQPETILANLPYVEWFRVDGKKHLAIVGHPSHPLGTLKEMDGVRAEELRQELGGSRTQALPVSALVVSSDIAGAAEMLERVTGVPLEALAPGIYGLFSESNQMLVVSPDLVPDLAPATYGVLSGRNISGESFKLRIYTYEFSVVTKSELTVLVMNAPEDG